VQDGVECKPGNACLAIHLLPIERLSWLLQGAAAGTHVHLHGENSRCLHSASAVTRPHRAPASAGRRPRPSPARTPANHITDKLSHWGHNLCCHAVPTTEHQNPHRYVSQAVHPIHMCVSQQIRLQPWMNDLDWLCHYTASMSSLCLGQWNLVVRTAHQHRRRDSYNGASAQVFRHTVTRITRLLQRGGHPSGSERRRRLRAEHVVVRHRAHAARTHARLLRCCRGGRCLRRPASQVQSCSQHPLCYGSDQSVMNLC